MKSGYLKHFASFIMLGIALAGCNAVDRLQNIGGAPQLAPITDPTKDPNYKPVTMPVAPPAGPRAENSLWLQGAHAFFHDPRASHVGDLITVAVSIADTAQVSNATTRTRANSDTANMTNFFGLENMITKNGADPASLVDMGSDTSNAGTGLINRSETINLTLAAIVTQLLPNGNLVITGHQQEVVVNNEMRDLQVSRHRAHGRHHERQHGQSRAGGRSAHRIWRQGPDHGRAAAALRFAALRHSHALVISALWGGGDWGGGRIFGSGRSSFRLSRRGKPARGVRGVPGLRSTVSRWAARRGV